MPLLLAILLLSLGIGWSASAVTIDWAFVGGPGNSCDPQPQGPDPGCFGAVGYAYSIATYEVTNSQYAEFLNAKAVSDPLGLYNAAMASVSGGITRGGSSGSYAYAAKPGRENTPVNYISFFDALRFLNWLNNGQGGGDTETGAYTLLGATATPSNWATVTRNESAVIFLPSEDEWYKAAYYDVATMSYFDFPAASNSQTACALPGATPNTANCLSAVGSPTPVGSYTTSLSPVGTYDQGGNVFEWNEFAAGTGGRGVRGGAFNSTQQTDLKASSRFNVSTLTEHGSFGFRPATIVPEPDTRLLLIVGLIGIARCRRKA
jgi:formylglycine-generating enzyme required for sulfatase activity